MIITINKTEWIEYSQDQSRSSWTRYDTDNQWDRMNRINRTQRTGVEQKQDFTITPPQNNITTINASDYEWNRTSQIQSCNTVFMLFYNIQIVTLLNSRSWNRPQCVLN